MRQDSWVRKYLDTQSFVVRHCHYCSVAYYSDIALACHLVCDEGNREPRLLRFLGADSDVVSEERLKEACARARGPSASL